MNLWEQLKIKHPGVIMYVGYRDFATIEVAKKSSPSGAISSYSVTISIPEIDMTENIESYKMADVEAAMKYVREAIEDLYEDIPEYTADDINDWIEDFEDEISQY